VSALKAAAAKGRVGVLVGGTATNEEAFAAQRIAQALKASADTALGPVIRAAKEALEARLGTWRMAADMTRIEKSKTIVLVHDDLEESHNVASVRIKDAVVRGKAKLVVIGALRSELVDFAALWLRPDAGNEGATASQIADALAGAQPASDDVARAAALLKDAPREDTLVICAPNPVSPAMAGAMAGGAANLAVALFGAEASSSLVVLPPEVNVHGLLDLGIGATGAANPLEGLSGLLVVRDDPTIRLPGAAEALAGIETIVVLDDVLHETAKRASVVIAAARAYASDGTYTQGDFRVQKLTAAVLPEGDGVKMYAALHALGTALGADLPATEDAALGEIARANPAYAPAWDLLVGDGVRLQVPPSNKGAKIPVQPLAAAEGIRVITSRDLYTALDAAELRHPEADKLHRYYDRIQVSEQDAERLGIVTGDDIEVSGNGATLRAKATVTDRVPAGSVYISSLFQGGAVVNLFAGVELPTVRVGVPVSA